jgi:hypothetical protein
LPQDLSIAKKQKQISNLILDLSNKDRKEISCKTHKFSCKSKI